MVSSEFKLDNDKPIIDTDIPKIIAITVTDIPKIIAKVIIFFINSFHSH